MEITALPFNRLIGLEQAGPDNHAMTSLPAAERYLNHIGSVHASALLAVAEAGTGELLLRLFQDSGLLPVLRTLEAKFRKPAHGRVTARSAVPDETVNAWKAELAKRGRALMEIPVEVIDESGALVLTATAAWFVTSSVT